MLKYPMLRKFDGLRHPLASLLSYRVIAPELKDRGTSDVSKVVRAFYIIKVENVHINVNRASVNSKWAAFMEGQGNSRPEIRASNWMNWS